jgi:hypothetical protein
VDTRKNSRSPGTEQPTLKALTPTAHGVRLFDKNRLFNSSNWKPLSTMSIGYAISTTTVTARFIATFVDLKFIIQAGSEDMTHVCLGNLDEREQVCVIGNREHGHSTHG